MDFYASTPRLAVEVDGAVHQTDDTKLHDERRDRWLAAQGVRVLQLPIRFVLDDLEGALRLITEAARTGLADAPSG